MLFVKEFRKPLYVVCLFCLTIACKRKVTTTATPVPATVQERPEITTGVSYLAFITFKITADTIIKIDTKIVEGKLKRDIPEDSLPASVPVLYYSLNGNDMKTISRSSMPHPLHKRVEYQDENDQFITKEVHLKEEDFFLRIQYTKEIKYIRFTERVGEKYKQLATIKL